MLKAATLNPKLEGQVHMLSGAQYTQLLDIGLSDFGHILAFTESGAVHVIRYDGESLQPMWEYSDVVSVSSSFKVSRLEML